VGDCSTKWLPRRTASAMEPTGSASARPRIVETPFCGMVMRSFDGSTCEFAGVGDGVVNVADAEMPRSAPASVRIVGCTVIVNFEPDASGADGVKVTTAPAAPTVPATIVEVVVLRTTMPAATLAGSI